MTKRQANRIIALLTALIGLQIVFGCAMLRSSYLARKEVERARVLNLELRETQKRAESRLVDEQSDLIFEQHERLEDQKAEFDEQCAHLAQVNADIESRTSSFKQGRARQLIEAGKGMKRRRMVVGLTSASRLLVLAMSITLGQQLRQDRLDRALIRAVKELDAPGVERLLAEGASANARDTGEPPLTLVGSYPELA